MPVSELEILKDPEQTLKEIAYAAFSKDFTKMVFDEVKETIRREVSKQLELHQYEIKEQVNSLISDAIKKMKLSVPLLTISMSAHSEEGDYE